MTAEFGDFQNIDTDRIIREAQQRADKLVAAQERFAALEGRAETADGYITASWSATGGLTELEINPRAMRMPSVDLSAAIKTVVRDAMADLQRQISAEVSSTFEGQDNPLELANDPAKVAAKINEMRDSLESAMGDASAHMEQMRKRLGL